MQVARFKAAKATDVGGDGTGNGADPFDLLSAGSGHIAAQRFGQ